MVIPNPDKLAMLSGFDFSNGCTQVSRVTPRPVIDQNRLNGDSTSFTITSAVNIPRRNTKVLLHRKLLTATDASMQQIHDNPHLISSMIKIFLYRCRFERVVVFTAARIAVP